LFKIFLISILLSAQALASDQRDESVSDRFISLAIQGDLRTAPSLLQAEDHSADVAGGEIARLFQARFIDQDGLPRPDTGDALADAVVTAYRDYWRRGLLGELAAASNRDRLDSDLAAVLAQHGYTSDSSSEADVHGSLGTALSDRGFYFLDDFAPPLQDLFLWTRESTRDYSVQLTDGPQPVRVVLMDGFHCLGWKDYASLGLAATTGWVADGVLYGVAPIYDLASEKFRVSFLKHEARHLADYARFPGLDADELEYRAKLTELVYASSSTIRLLRDFTAKAAPNPASPHALANYRLIRDLYREIHGAGLPATGDAWAAVSTPRVQRAARDLLARHTRLWEARYAVRADATAG
jgi:hypothetical protein